LIDNYLTVLETRFELEGLIKQKNKMEFTTFTQRNFMRSKEKLLFAFWLILAFHISAFSQHTNDSTATQHMKLVTPDYLQRGDSIVILAPAGVLKNKEHFMYQAKDLAESWGLKVTIAKNAFNDNNHLAGTDEERANDFQNALDNPNIKAIWCARGGYGSVRILDQLDFSTFKKHPKWIIGYSDVTVFHSHLHNMGYETIHGMMGISMMYESAETQQSKETLRKALFGESISYELTPSKYNVKGTVEGELIGGNLTILLTLLGSETQLNTDGKILFIEEIGEYKYHIDRMLQSLKRAGYFKNLKGLIVGDMTNIKKNSPLWGTSIEQLILDATSEYDFPILFGFPGGHEPDNRALIFGRTVEISATQDHSKVTFK
jgi:muramoyltetrapeptide carboxypeptidase